MTDPASSGPGTHRPAGSTAPTITAAGCVITGAGFLPDHEVTVRICYTAEDISDYLTYTTDARGNLRAELPTSPGAGALHITATDHRSDPDSVCGLLWSNTQTVRAADPWAAMVAAGEVVPPQLPHSRVLEAAPRRGATRLSEVLAELRESER